MEKQYEGLDDGTLIAQLRGGDDGVMEYLLEKYKNLVRKQANAVFLLGGDMDDLIQEGMIGLFRAIRDYDAAQGSFFQFAQLCIRRQIYHAIEAAGRFKHMPLNSYVSLSAAGQDRDEPVFGEAVSARDTDPEALLIDRENAENLLAQINATLSPMERNVLALYLEGHNYRQIAEQMKKPEKSIDNALQRIKGKVQRLLN